MWLLSDALPFCLVVSVELMELLSWCRHQIVLLYMLYGKCVFLEAVSWIAPKFYMEFSVHHHNHTLG